MKAVARMELKPGMTLGEDVRWQEKILFSEGTVLSQANIERLKRYNIMIVTVMEDVDFATTHYERLRYSHDFKIFEQKHAQNLYKYKKLMMDFATSGKQIPAQALMEIYSDLRSTYSNGAILLDYLYNLMPNEDELTFNHSLNSALLAGVFAEWTAMSEEDREELILSGFYYDIGKLKLPYDVLWRPGKLSQEEFDVVKKHPSIGWAMLGNTGLSSHIQDAVLMHHERMDGSGYPKHAKGDEISIFARYIAIIDTYIAMASPRPHRNALTPLQIMGNFEKNVAQYDKELLIPLMIHIADAQIGSSVCLNDDSVWEVSHIHATKLSRPVLKNAKQETLDLREHPELEIVKMM
ncbi:MAG: HD domain-containing protein [Acetatifactor sp.]|nr:HD domain-containing protein [Acetatifactor sp.]